MRYFLATLIALFSFLTVFGQSNSFQISGKVYSAADETPLESATIYAQRAQDSTLITYTISNREGFFQIEDRITDKNLRLFISYVGMATHVQTVPLDKEEIDLGTIYMKNDNNALDEVVVRSTPPITIKKDTLEFNVSSFKTKKDASVEDLLKKLPGVEVDNDGNILVNGKSVNKILVNGKPFFGNDPTITTRNLTKEIIEKVQVTDTKTDAEAFAGENSDGENKTINLTIKEENNKGVFGRLAAGGGTDDRYEFAGLFNRFDNDQRFSVLAGGNNINSSGFSFGEIRKMFGGARSLSVNSNGSFVIDGRSFGSGNGIVTSRNGGANYADAYGDNLDISADYFYGGGESEDRSSISRENLLPDRRFFSNSNSETMADYNNHNLNVKFDIKVDSTFLINIKPSAQYADNSRNFSRSEKTLNEDGQQTNTSETSQMQEGDTRSFSNEFDITKRFGSRGASLRFSLNNNWEQQTGADFLSSTTEIFGDNPETIERNQFIDSETKSTGINANIRYSYPIIAKKFFINGEFNYRNDERDNVESTFDFNEGNQQYDSFNLAQSTDFTYTNQRITPELGFGWRGEKLNASISAGYVSRKLENRDALRPETSFENTFEAIEGRAYMNYRFNQKRSIYVNYRLSNQPPDLRQLQPIPDVSDPLNIVTGNPNLKPANQHNLYIGFNAFDWQKRTGFNFYAGMNLTSDQPTSRTVVDENLVRTTTFENVDGNYNGFVSGSYSKRVKLDSLRSLRLRLRINGNVGQNTNFFNGVKYQSNTNALGPNARITFEWDELFEIEPSYELRYTETTYDIEGLENRNFITHNLNLETATFFPEKFEWRNEINFNYNPNVAAGFQRSAWFWNSVLSYSVLKDNGTISVKAYDLLNQNTNARRTATENYIQDSESLVLRQYFMLSFSWKFNSLGKEGETGRGRGFFMD